MIPISSETRLAILCRMVKAAPKQGLGRTQIMKLFYFLQELKGIPLGYDFRLFNYGPFDSEVLSDLSSACGLDAVVETTVLYPRGYGYNITLGANADRVSQSLEEDHAEIVGKVEEVVREFGVYGAAELELRSTILFADREMSQAGTSTTEGELADRVRQIKPYFTVEAILDRVNEMKRKGWLDSLSLPAAR
jgi:uncharacterized protein